MIFSSDKDLLCWLTINSGWLIKTSKRTRKRTRNPSHKDQLLQDQVSTAFDYDQQSQLDAHLASLDLADQWHEHGTAWQIINHIAGDFNKANPSKVRLQNRSIPKNKESSLKGGESTLLLFSI